MVGESAVGKKVVDHLPDSWNWRIQLWTLDDCLAFCADELKPNRRYDVKMLEPFIIQKLHPILNVIYNLEPGIDHTPKSEKEKQRKLELDEVFRKVFEKKTKKDT